jgi:hypothetical protein
MLCRLSTCIMPRSMSGTWPVPSLDESLQQACIWAKEACALLVHGQIEDLVAAIGKLPPIPPAPGESRSVPDKAVDYFTTNAERMRYPTFRATSACMWAVALPRPPVKAWWRPVPSELACGFPPEGLDAILPLRTAKLNHTYDEFWEQQSRRVA